MDPFRGGPVVGSRQNLRPEPELDQDGTSRRASPSLEAAEEALRTCDNAHNCKEQSGLTAPTRLLDVGQDVSDQIKVIISAEEDQLNQRTSKAYAALSYCWGTCPAFKSTQSNLSSRTRGFSLSEMPLTLQDAVQVTRRLGLQYLWVDALCILQDCKQDWQRESARMGDVYGHAFITIFAFAARDCEGGLFLPAEKISRAASPYIYPIEPRFMDEPLNLRAWALQEWYLSPRRLMFTSCGPIFDCLHGPEHEYICPFSNVYSHRPLPTCELKPLDWQMMVMNYSTRDLSHTSDKLHAIAGLAGQFDRLSDGRNGRYLAGIWEAHLPCSLLWVRYNEPTPVREIVDRAPSWSWASIDGPINFVGLREKGDWEVTAQILSCDLHLAVEEEPLGPATCRLRIRHPMKSLPKDGLKVVPNLLLRFKTKEKVIDAELRLYSEGSLAASIWGDEAMNPFVEGPDALHFCAVMKSKVEARFWGLLLVEVSHATFQRIGCGWCVASWFEDAVERDAEII